MKKALISYKKRLTVKILDDFRRKLGSYDKFFILTTYNDVNDKDFERFKKFNITVCKIKEIPSKIDQIFKEKRKKFIFFPYFTGDAKSKYAIKIYNKSFGLKINPQIFKIKNKMNEFLGNDITRKKSVQFDYDEIQKKSYSSIVSDFGDIFIIKPTNAASSISNFQISSEENFEMVKKKLRKKYKYVIEEYLGGSLYSLDFFCNGKDIFLLTFVREIPFLEMLQRFSDNYMDKYQKYLTSEFLHFIPIRYTLPLKKITDFELDFVKKIGHRLCEYNYHGFIHLEYKVDRKAKKIGFIEWGARTGWKRDYFIDGMYKMRIENLPREILSDKDFSRFKKNKGVYFLRNKDIDKNFVGIMTNVTEKTHVLDILNKTPKFLNTSLEQFIMGLFWDKWRIKIDKINFYLMASQEGYLYPFYERSDAKLKYIMEMKEKPFKKLLKNKHKILEKLVFHDYENI